MRGASSSIAATIYPSTFYETRCREAVSTMRGTAPGMGREESILATIACHSAVKLGDKLSQEEMEALIKE